MPEVGFNKWIITLTIIISCMLELIDTTVVNVSLPQIMGNLGATLEDVSWVVTAYAVANVIILPMSGWLSANFGRRNYFLASIIIFTIASFLCGNATNIWELTCFRVLQGLAGGGLLSTGQSILIETWPKEQLGMAMALFGLGIVVAPTLGPTLGGYITDHYNWPWVFYINIPIGIIATLMTLSFIHGSKTIHPDSTIDWLGIILLTIGVGSLQIVLERGETEDWFDTPYIVVLSFVSALGIVAFIWRELTADHPVVDLRVLKNRGLMLGMITTFILGFCMFGSVFIFPVFCQQLLGFSAQQTGMLLIPGGLATIFMMPMVGVLLKKGFPPQVMALIGMLLFFAFTVMLSSSNLSSGTGDFALPLIIRGVGLSLLFVPLTTLALGSLKGKDIPSGTGLNNMMRQLGGSFGIAILNTVLHWRLSFHRSILIENINQYNNAFVTRLNAATQGLVAAGKSFAEAQLISLKAIDFAVMKQTALLSYNDAFYLVGILFLMAIPFLFLQPIKKADPKVKVDAH